jgi:hypothetical protein
VPKPGPARVVAFAKKVETQCTGDSAREKGLRATMTWVMGDNRSHPVTERQTPPRAYPPNSLLIEQAERLARRARGRRQPDPDKAYVEAVLHCLEWMNGRRSQEPRP